MRKLVLLLAACTPPSDPLEFHVVADVKTVVEAQAIPLAVDKPDATLTYRWTQVSPADPKGSFADVAAPSTTWLAPIVCESRTFTLQLRVSKDGEQRSETVDITVDDASEPQPPVIALSSTNVIAGDEVTATLAVAGPGCPTAGAVNWTENTGGVFTAPKTTQTKWRSGVIGADTTATLSAEVSGVSHSATVIVRAPTHAEVEKTFEDATCYTCHVSGGQSGGFDMRRMTATSNAGRTDCGSGRFFVPGDPDKSIFIKRLRRNGCSPNGGTRMPWDNTAWFDEHPGALVRIESWVKAGAAF